MRLIIAFLLLFSIDLSATETVNLTQITALNLTSAGTAQVMSATNVYCQCAIMNALAGNTGVMYVGDSAVTSSNGLVLAKGDSVILCSENKLNLLNLKNFYFDGGTTNDDMKVSCSRGLDVRIVPKPL